MSGMVTPTNPDAMMPAGDPAQQIVDMLTTKQDQVGPDGNPVPEPDRVDRDPPDPPEPRRRLVAKWIARVKADKKHYEQAFKRMRKNGEFTQGHQWDQDYGMFTGPEGTVQDKRYVANVTLRHVQQRTASLYASNPEVVAKKRDRMIATVWEGDMQSLQVAQQQLAQAALQQAQAALQGGPPPVPGVPPPGAEQAVAIITDWKNVQAYDKMLGRVCKTLEILWNYNVDEQTFAFKPMMKMTVRRAIVTGVGYVKLGFQRAMKMNPEIETRIADMVERLATVERLANDIADDEIERTAAEMEQLRLSIQALQQEPEIIAREGLLFDYPDSASIIPDKKCKSLRGFLGADWVTQEYMLSPDEIQEVYGVDVGRSYRAYRDAEDILGGAEPRTSGATGMREQSEDDECGMACVWEVYSRKDGLVYVLCDGYADFLREPAAPDVYLDRFWPWFPIILNEGYHAREIFPKSDIDLMRDMQLELNRARQGLREHRRANRPKMAIAAGVMEDTDKDKLKNHPANAVIELNALAPGQKIEDVIMPFKMPAIDPALYDTDSTFEDILRVLGQDQASAGQTTDATATEAAIAQGAQHTDLDSVLDDQDEMLSELAMAAGKVLLMNVSAQTVTKIVGPGAVWPELTKEDIVDNIYLTVRAGSTGRPNRQQEIQNSQILFPMLQRIPGISPEWMARELIKRLDDRLDLTEAFIDGMPSMDALNRIQGTVSVPEPQDPQNPQAAANAVNPPPPPVAAPTPPPGAAPSPAGMPPPPSGARLGGPPAPHAPVQRPPGAGGGSSPTAPPMGGAPNDPNMQGNQGGNNAPVPNPPNGLLGARMPPVPGANGLMPGHGGGPKTRPQGGIPTP